MKSQRNSRGKEIRFRFFKKGEFKYLSHLDIVSIITKALRRAGIKVKYSEGYNPKPKINFSSPTPLGIESLAEYGDIVLTDDLRADEFLQKINFSLKELNQKLERIKLIDSREISHKVPSLMEDISVGLYSFELTTTTGGCYTEDFIQDLETKLRKDYTSPT
ncbi:MAG: DUF2344 domain-containing protein, partial [Actinobacteria bacterium]|nr:DUF2344 domain-containing protein [Actinomycetota bacterium]